jgi:hypothetical protein
MKYLLCLVVIALTIFAGCHFFEPRYIKLADQITLKTAKQLQQEDNLALVGTGGQMMHDIQMMAMSFYLYHEVDLNEARALLIHAVNQYLLAINSDEKIRPYLHEYPFTAKNLEVRIWAFNADGSEVPLDKIYYLCAIGGIFKYYLNEPETFSRKLIHKETFEEAVEKMNDPMQLHKQIK